MIQNLRCAGGGRPLGSDAESPNCWLEGAEGGPGGAIGGVKSNDVAVGSRGQTFPSGAFGARGEGCTDTWCIRRVCSDVACVQTISAPNIPKLTKPPNPRKSENMEYAPWNSETPSLSCKGCLRALLLENCGKIAMAPATLFNPRETTLRTGGERFFFASYNFVQRHHNHRGRPSISPWNWTMKRRWRMLSSKLC